jgi:hypothetical protein
MAKKMFISGLIMIFCAGASGQLKKDNDVLLSTHVFGFLEDRDNIHIAVRKPEAEILIFDIDSLGKIASIHLYSDQEQRDVSFSILKQLKPIDLSDLTFTNWENAAVILPVVTVSEQSSFPKDYGYIAKINWAMPHIHIQGQTVLINPIFHLMPQAKKQKNGL